MERFWNIMFYFAYRVEVKLTYCLYQYTGIFKLYDQPFIKNRCEKINIKKPTVDLLSISGRIATILVTGGHFSFLLGLLLFYIAFSTEKPKSFEPVLVVMILSSIISFSVSYVFLFHKNKYLKYFKEFDKKPRKWKIKWAWISFGVILFPFITLAISFMVMSK